MSSRTHQNRSLRSRTPRRPARRFRRFVPMILISVIALVTTVPTVAIDYAVYGDVSSELRYAWNERADPTSVLVVPITARLSHSLAGDSFDLTATTIFASPGAAASPGDGADPALITLRLPELSLSAYPASWLTARFGRFSLDWGTGYVFAPGNTLERRTFGESSTGIDGVSVSVIPGASVTVGSAVSFLSAAVAAGDRPWENLTTTTWIDGFTGGLDWFAGFQYRYDLVTRPSVAISFDLAGTILAA